MGRFTKCFRQQYSKIGNTREQLFHMWRLFHFEENAETIDAPVNHLRQVETLLGYQEPQILEVFKITLPTKLYWVLVPIMDLRQAVETAKRILTKEKTDRQWAGQTFSTPFMNIRDSCNKRVTFNMTDGMEQKIEKLTVMMGKLVTENEGENKPFKPWVSQSNRGRGKTRCNFDQRRYQGSFRSNSAYRGHSRYSQDYRGRTRYDSNNIGSYRYNARSNQQYGRFNNNSNRRGNYRNQNYNRNRSRSYERQTRDRRDSRSVSNSTSRSGSRASTEIDLDVLSVENAIILQGNVQLGRQVGK